MERDGDAEELLTTVGLAARTALLCLHISVGVDRYTQRMGTLTSLASFTQSARVSESALVLSAL